MLLYRTLRIVTSTNMRKNMYVVTPRCAAAAAAAAAVVSALVLRRPTKEYTQPYSMMHRRLPTAGVEVAPHYHQLLVICSICISVVAVYQSQYTCIVYICNCFTSQSFVFSHPRGGYSPGYVIYYPYPELL